MVSQGNRRPKVVMSSTVHRATDGGIFHKEARSLARAGFDVLILPSYSEGIPKVILEAMACELPVVATPVGGIPEAVAHEDTGFLVPVGDRQALASSILALAENRDLRRSMGEAGRKRAQAAFRWDKFASDASELYCSVLRTGAERQKSALTAERT